RGEDNRHGLCCSRPCHLKSLVPVRKTERTVDVICATSSNFITGGSDEWDSFDRVCPCSHNRPRGLFRRLGERPMNRRGFLKTSSIAAGAIAVNGQFSERALEQCVEGALRQVCEESLTFRRPKTIFPVPIPSPQFQHVEAGVPDTQLTREAAALLREFSTPLLINHSHRVFFWANEMGRQTGQKFDVELLFICAAFHDFGLLRKFSSATD